MKIISFQPKVRVNVVIVEQCIHIYSHLKSTIEKTLRRKLMSNNSPTKGKRMKWDQEKAIHQKLVGEIQRL
jgi:hypothetical protein